MPPTASSPAATHPPCQQVRRRALGGQAAADGTVQYESVWSAVSGLAPWSGPVLGGTLVTVSGIRLAAAALTFDRELARMSDPQWGWYRTGMQL